MCGFEHAPNGEHLPESRSHIPPHSGSGDQGLRLQPFLFRSVRLNIVSLVQLISSVFSAAYEKRQTESIMKPSDLFKLRSAYRAWFILAASAGACSKNNMNFEETMDGFLAKVT